MTFKNKEVVDYALQNEGGGINPTVLDNLVDKAVDENQVQADWNENDETAKGYIKNRPGGYYSYDTKVAETVTQSQFAQLERVSGQPSLSDDSKIMVLRTITGSTRDEKVIFKGEYKELFDKDNASEIGFFLYKGNSSVVNTFFIGEERFLYEIYIGEEVTVPSEFLPFASSNNPGIISLDQVDENERINYSSSSIKFDYYTGKNLVIPTSFNVVDTLSKENIRAVFAGASPNEHELVIKSSIEDDGKLGLLTADYPIRVYTISYRYSGEIIYPTLHITKTDGSYTTVEWNARQRSFPDEIAWTKISQEPEITVVKFANNNSSLSFEEIVQADNEGKMVIGLLDGINSLEVIINTTEIFFEFFSPSELALVEVKITPDNTVSLSADNLPVIIPSSTPDSEKRFKISVDDTGVISATELT